MPLTLIIMMSFIVTMSLMTIAIFITMSTVRVMRLQQQEAYAVQQSQALNPQQLRYYLRTIPLTPMSVSATQEIQKTRPMPPPSWIRTRAGSSKSSVEDSQSTQEIPSSKAS